jgi:hypothetical protein
MIRDTSEKDVESDDVAFGVSVSVEVCDVSRGKHFVVDEEASGGKCSVAASAMMPGTAGTAPAVHVMNAGPVDLTLAVVVVEVLCPSILDWGVSTPLCRVSAQHE